MNALSRRRFLAGAGILSMGLLLDGCTQKEESNEITALNIS